MKFFIIFHYFFFSLHLQYWRRSSNVQDSQRWSLRARSSPHTQPCPDISTFQLQCIGNVVFDTWHYSSPGQKEGHPGWWSCSSSDQPGEEGDINHSKLQLWQGRNYFLISFWIWMTLLVYWFIEIFIVVEIRTCQYK